MALVGAYYTLRSDMRILKNSDFHLDSGAAEDVELKLSQYLEIMTGVMC